jgi:hypothetical protein
MHSLLPIRRFSSKLTSLREGGEQKEEEEDDDDDDDDWR